MSVYRYPVFFMRVGEDAILGQVIGEYYQCIDTSEANVISKLKKLMLSDAKQGHLYLDNDLSECELRIIKIKTQASVIVEQKKYTSKQMIHFPMAAVIGKSEYGDYDCYLPFFDESFYFDNLDDLHNLVLLHGGEALKRLEPNVLYSKLAIYQKPWLGRLEISYRVARKKENNVEDSETKETIRELSRLARQVTKTSLRDRQAFSGITWEREKLIDRISDKLLNESSNFILLGPSGSGKSNLLGAAIKASITRHKTKDKTQWRTYWRCSAHRFLSGAKYLGDWQENCEHLIDRLQKVGGLLWVDDFTEMLFKGGDSPESSVAAFFEPFLSQQHMRIIGEASLEQWQKARREYSRFCEHFETLEVPELTEDEMKRLLTNLSEYAKENRRVEIDSAALEVSSQLLNQFVKAESNPGKTIRFFNHCLSEAHALEQKVLKFGDIVHLFSKRYGVNELFVNEQIKLNEQQIREKLSKEVIGQDHVFSELIEIMKIFKLALNDPKKPIATLVFSGPTGVGKTAMVKSLAKVFFQSKEGSIPLVRLDMSEYQHPRQVEKLIGSGSDQPGYLIKEAQQNPFHILLLDEIEKAHPRFFDILLSILDEGKLVDHMGRQAHFKNSIVIMTTNLGSNQADPVGFGDTSMTDPRSVIAKFFRPEFINRVDRILVFNSLGREEAKQITELELNKLNQREGIKKRKLVLKFSDDLKEWIAKEGFSAKYGARFLQRTIEEKIVGPLSREILQYGYKNGEISFDFLDSVLKIKFN